MRANFGLECGQALRGVEPGAGGGHAGGGGEAGVFGEE